MGSNQSTHFTETRDFNNTIMQYSNQSCSITCTTSFNDNVVIVIGGSGNINIENVCSIQKSSCQMKAAFDASIETIIDSAISQSTTAVGGLSFTFNNIDQSINVASHVTNNISQLMNSSCTLAVQQSINNNYFYIQDRTGDINWTQKGDVTSSTCSMENVGKASTFNKTTVDAKQKSEVQNVFTLLFMSFIVLIIGATIVLVAFVMTGGVATVAGALSQAQQSGPAGQMGSELEGLGLPPAMVAEAEEAAMVV